MISNIKHKTCPSNSRLLAVLAPIHIVDNKRFASMRVAIVCWQQIFCTLCFNFDTTSPINAYLRAIGDSIRNSGFAFFRLDFRRFGLVAALRRGRINRPRFPVAYRITARQSIPRWATSATGLPGKKILACNRFGPKARRFIRVWALQDF
jgi:hypothetical protein